MSQRDALTNRQQQVLEFIRKEIASKGYPPSVREIGEALGLSSPSTVHSHLSTLEAKGYIKRDPSKPRALEVMYEEGCEVLPFTKRNNAGISSVTESDVYVHNSDVRSLPVVGSVAAGEPILATENIEQTLPLPKDFVGEDTAFMLKVRGDSMIEAGILDGDFVVVRQQNTANNGDIVVALLDDSATVKRFFRESNHIRLQPENAALSPILTRDVEIIGKVIALFRGVI